MWRRQIPSNFCVSSNRLNVLDKYTLGLFRYLNKISTVCQIGHPAPGVHVVLVNLSCSTVCSEVAELAFLFAPFHVGAPCNFWYDRFLGPVLCLIDSPLVQWLVQLQSGPDAPLHYISFKTLSFRWIQWNYNWLKVEGHSGESDLGSVKRM